MGQTRMPESHTELFEEFARTFCIRPGVKLIETLEGQKYRWIIEWLRHDPPEPLAHSFVLSWTSKTRDGIYPWNSRNFSLLTFDYSPSQSSIDAISILVKLLGIPGKYSYKETPESQVKTLEFNP